MVSQQNENSNEFETLSEIEITLLCEEYALWQQAVL